MTQNMNILENYELTDHNGNPIPEDLYRVLQEPNDEFGYYHNSEKVCPSTFYDNICDILEKTELTEGEIIVIEQSTYDGYIEAHYAIEGGMITDISNSNLMKYCETILFKLKEQGTNYD